MAEPWVCWYCVLVLVTSADAVRSISDHKMTQAVHCPGQVLSTAHRSQAFPVRSLLHCLSRCPSTQHCHSAVFNSLSFLCYLGNVCSETDCSNMEPGPEHLRFYEMAPADPRLTVEVTQSPEQLEATGTTDEREDTDTQASSAEDTHTSILETQTTSPSVDTNTPTPVSQSITMETDASTETHTDLSTTSSDCQNGGHLDGNGSCLCVNSHVGPLCERIMEDCGEGRDSGFYTEHGQYMIYPSRSSSPFPVYCQMTKHPKTVGRTMVFKRFDPKFTFNHTWEDFRLGFGDLNGDHWLGLEKLHQLTNSKTYDLRFTVKTNVTFYGSFFYNFTVGNKINGYKFTVGIPHNLEAGDCMSEHQGAMFSTYDADKDDNTGLNCAAEFGGGWWYSGTNCSACNILGPVLSEDGQRQGVVGEMFWPDFGDSYPFPLSAFLVVP